MNKNISYSVELSGSGLFRKVKDVGIAKEFRPSRHYIDTEIGMMLAIESRNAILCKYNIISYLLFDITLFI